MITGLLGLIIQLCVLAIVWFILERTGILTGNIRTLVLVILVCLAIIILLRFAGIVF